jgi:hypothetical protein
MNEQAAERHEELDGWPMPSPDVLRELDQPSLSWSRHEGESESEIGSLGTPA